MQGEEHETSNPRKDPICSNLVNPDKTSFKNTFPTLFAGGRKISALNPFGTDIQTP